MKKALTILDYLKNEQSSFDEKPFCSIDAFVLAVSSYLLFENAPISQTDDANTTPQHEGFTTKLGLEEPVLVSEALEKIPRNLLSDLFWFDGIAPEFAQTLAANKRFAALEVSDVATALDQEYFTQFDAMCFHVPDGSIYLSFRGTDNTITGWEEDFTLSILDPIPSQLFALEYTYAMMDKWLHAQILLQMKPRHAKIPSFRLGGHSKGANLAFYAASHCKQPYQSAITQAYSFDGPGVNPWKKDADTFKAIQSRLTKIVPVHSVFGRIFDDIAPIQIVKSSEFALMQHMPFSWELAYEKGAYSFLYEGTPSLLSDSTNLGLSRWIASLNAEERAEFCSVLFGVVEFVAEDNNIESLQKNILGKVPAIAKHLASLDGDSQQFIYKVISSLIGDLADSFRESLLNQFSK